VLLAGAGAQAAQRPIDAGYSRQTAYSVDDPALDRLQRFFLPTLDANRKEFAGRTGPVKAFGAGSRYPQVWLRDGATVIPLSRYLYSREHLTSWIEEHFAHQRESGELFDWLAAGPASAFREWAPSAVDLSRAGGAPICADKNTVEADQESSAVSALARVFRITGDRAWLAKPIADRTLIERAQAALQFLVLKRFDGSRGLVTSGFSADWGDVSPVHPDQRAIYLDPQTPLVTGLYTNSLFLAAVLDLASVLESIGHTGRAAYWRHIAQTVDSGLERTLWDERRGFYRLHRLLEPSAARWDDADVFAMGGNGLAMLSGAADERQVLRILRAAEERRRRYGVSTIAGTLLPPYPRGFFKHPMLSEPYAYQNGGQWDWLGGRFVLALFERGAARAAYEQLVAIARKADSNGGLYEWHTRDGKGQGSPRYAGSAGALAAAVFQGLFGVYLGEGELSLKVRLAGRPGRIHLHQPATDTFVAYEYRPDGTDTLRLQYESNHPRRGEVSILLPAGLKARALRLDGEEKPFEPVRVGEDDYIRFPSDWRPHTAELALEAPPAGRRLPGKR
jgi:hypothetical protein